MAGRSSPRSPNRPTMTRRPPKAAGRARSWPPLADIAIPADEPLLGPAPSDVGDHHGGHESEHASSLGLSNNKLGMWLFLGSECLLFGGLIAVYMLYRGRHARGPSPDQVYSIAFPSVSSFVLLMSSLTMVLAVSSAQRDDWRRVHIWLTVTALLGATFVGGQVYEFTAFYK